MNLSSIKLNKEQKEAVEYGRGPLLIIAGAGTGKTTVITERVKHLIFQELAKPKRILALTFTDKAAREMEERIDIAMPYGYTQMWVLTFHAFCDRILRNEAIHIGLNPGYKLMSQAETVAFLRRNLFKFELNYFRPLGNPTKFVQGIVQHFSRLKDEDVSPGEYLRWAQEQREKSKEKRAKIKNEDRDEVAKSFELANAYKKYQELKVKEGLMDFGDLIGQTLKLFRTRRNILKQYQEQFKYILVDEFQDTNIAQYELAKLLAPPKGNPNLTVVGDDSQSIYKFRGAAISNILSFMKDYPKAKQVVLIKNYRSTQTILDHAYQLIKHNDPDTLEAKLGINKNLISAKDKKDSAVGLIYADRVENEAEEVVKEIRKLRKSEIRKYEYRNFAILVRANNHADPFMRALHRAGIPYQFLGPGVLFKQAEVKDLIAYLKILYNFEDSISLYRVLTMPLFDISARDLTSLNIFARKYNLSLFEACERITAYYSNYKNYQLPFISRKTKESLLTIVKMIHRHLKHLSKDTAGQILYYFLEDSGLLKNLTNYKTVPEERKAQNISRFFDKLKTYEVEHEDASVSAVVDWLELSLELGESPLASELDWFEANAVNILTAHSSKGLEFPVVFLVNLTVGRFPTYERREQIPIPDELIKEILPEGDYHLQEERRLFYVGMTRAMDRLYLTAANYYGEGKRERKLSPFVIEALGEEKVKTIKQFNNKTPHHSLRSGAGQAMKQLSFLDFGRTEETQIPDIRYQIPVTYLSYSQLETFNSCPLKYKYRYILKIPTPTSAAASFGQSIHETLKEFYQEVKKGKKPKVENLDGLLAKNWLPIGYASKTHEATMKKEGRKMLQGFYEKGFDPQVIPQDLEQFFAVRVSPILKIGGRIDRVDKVNGKLEIVDYKTGKVTSQKEIDKSLQMTVYALAASDQGIYGQKPEDLILTFYFLQTQEKISTKRSKDDLVQAKKEILKKAKEISKSDFEPTPGKHCDFCDYKFLCPVWQQ